MMASLSRRKRSWYCRSFFLVNCLMVLLTATILWRNKLSTEVHIYKTQSPQTAESRHTQPNAAAVVLNTNTSSLDDEGKLSPEETVGKAGKSQAKQDGSLSGYVAVSNITRHLKYKCGRCAIVSNSGQILKRKAGHEIDENDCVIRMNDSPVPGFEEDVGAKTHLRIISFASIGLFNSRKLFGESDPAKTVIFWGPKDLMKTDGTGRTFNTLTGYQKNFSNVQFYIFTQEKLDEDHKLYEKETHLKIGPIWASTGWFTMLFATEVCDSITVYGMGHPDFCKKYPSDKTPYHYYQPAGQKECSRYLIHERQKKGVHRYRSERDVFLRWMKTSSVNLTFNHPSW
ncbi:alpha-N-acetylgalactosaminide alpha-2,6-sialyltransferase 5-like isoform X2 [Ptychodera flava]|uniref:alpha-N-acetylgalactosaminide alpha-2,6-sialyltransferase 5-like isoform X2 n=1 Tax=Ptychodera flava TaxID=63121 RepID=UPI003969CFCE